MSFEGIQKNGNEELFLFKSVRYIDHYSRIWGVAPPTILEILDCIQKKAFRLINIPFQASSTAVGYLPLFSLLQ